MINELFCLFSFPKIVQATTTNNPAGGSEEFQVNRLEKKRSKTFITTPHGHIRNEMALFQIHE